MTRTVRYLRSLAFQIKLPLEITDCVSVTDIYRCVIYLKRLSGAKKFYILVFLPGGMSFW